MSIREKLNGNPLVVMGLVVVVVLVAGWTISGSGANTAGVPKLYYTTDDGATWFAGDTEQITPFESGGKQAVRAFVFTCNSGKEFVGFLERYSDEAKATLREAEEMAKRGQKPDIQKLQMAGTRGRLVKKAGDKDWVSASDPRGVKIQAVTCPDGTAAMRAD